MEENLEILDKEWISVLIRKTKKIKPYLKILDSTKRQISMQRSQLKPILGISLCLTTSFYFNRKQLHHARSVYTVKTFYRNWDSVRIKFKYLVFIYEIRFSEKFWMWINFMLLHTTRFSYYVRTGERALLSTVALFW